MPSLARNPINPWGRRLVTTAGTPVLLFSIAEVPVAAQGIWPVRVSRLYIEALASNTGFIYIGTKGMVVSTGVGVIQTLPPPAAGTVNFIDWTENFAGGTNNYKLQDYWIDSSVSGEGVLRTTWIF